MRAVRWAVGIVGELFITLGVLLLLFVSWQLWWTDVTSNRQQASTIQALERDFSGSRGDEPLATLSNVPFGEAFAILRVPRFGSDNARPVLQGTDRETLINGIGHYPGTVMPGVVGNFSVAGHRTTYGKPFSDIDLLQKGDFVVVETKTKYIVYAVDRHVIVTPDHVEVIAPVPEQPQAKPTAAWLTMTACHPKFSARERYVVFAKLVKTIARADGLPATYMATPKGST